MVELTHDTADDGFHEIQLSGKQLVALFLVATTVVVVVFLCGVRVGRGARDAQDEPEQTTAATAPVQQPAPVVATPPSEPPAPAGDAQDLSYQKRLNGEATPVEKLKRQEEPRPERAPPVSVPAVAAAKSAPPPAAAPVPVTAATTGSAAKSAESDDLPTSGHPGTWAVQVLATRDRAVAGSLVKRLTAKGYPAFLVNPSAGASPAWYKVHVGRYNDRGEAEKVSLRIKKEEQYQSWITR